MVFSRFFSSKPDIEKLKVSENIKGLIKALQFEKDPEVQAAAEKALVEIGTPAVERLINLLKDKHKDGQDYAITALGRIGDTRAVGPLTAVLEENWIFVPEALARIGTPQAIEPLLAILKDPSGSIVVQNKVLEALRLANAPQIVEPLSMMLVERVALKYGDDTNKIEFRKNLILVLSNYKCGLTIWAIKLAAQDISERVKATAASAIEKIKALPGPVEDLYAVAKFFNGDDSWLRAKARETLIEFGDEERNRSLLPHLKDKPTDRQGPADRISADPTSGRSIEEIVELLNDRKPHVRLAAARYLAKSGWESRNQQEAAYLAVGQGKFNKAAEFGVLAVQPLLDFAREAGAYPTRDVIGALNRIGVSAIEALAAALEDKEERVRLTAARALGNLKDIQTLEPLARALHDDSRDVRREAINSLLALGEPSAWELCTQAAVVSIGRREEETARAICEALDRAGDKKGVQIIADALEKVDIQRGIVYLENGISELAGVAPENDRNLKDLVESIATFLGSPARLQHLPTSLITKLAALKDATDAEQEISTDPHDSFYAVVNWYPVTVDCSKIRLLAAQELSRRQRAAQPPA
jgi:HEAT repeat protein